MTSNPTYLNVNALHHSVRVSSHADVDDDERTSCKSEATRSISQSVSRSTSERANSPFPVSPILSDYGESVLNAYLDSNADEESYEHEEEMDEDEDDVHHDSEHDLSSDPPQQRSDGEWDRIEDEIRSMEDGIEGICHYEIVDKLGEGTFSSVYKAVDKNHYLYDNYLWTGKLPGPPPAKLSREGRSSKNVYVALKRIYVTSSPQRILNELEIMEDLRDCSHIAFLITAFRTEDQIIAVMPYSRHADFRDYYRIMPLMDLKCYFRCLFSALEGAHAANIIHRDVKPANFLYDPRAGDGTLCDFGLAERFEPSEWRGKCHHTCPTADHPFGRVSVNKVVHSSHLEPGGALHESAKTMSAGVRNKAMGPPERIGVLKEDVRQSVRANRAGTRGFRAPEVLYKCQDQTTALDIWSAGIILMAFLTKRFPLFNSNDDTEALMELTIILGRRRMTQVAILHNRTFHCNVPAERTDGWRIPDFIVRLNPDILSPPPNHPHPEEYVGEVQQAMDLCRLCLQGDLTKRCTASEALKHPFLLDVSSPSTVSSSGGRENWAV